MVNSFIVSLGMTLMINVFLENIKSLHEKMLKARNLYWLHNDASEKKSLNGHFDKPRRN